VSEKPEIFLKRIIVPLVAAGLLVAACSRSGGESARVKFESGPVILISVDTLRADRLPVYGYDGVKTPNLDRFRKDAILFENAYAQVPLTLPSHVSLLTGTLPADNGVRNNVGYVLDRAAHPTIPQMLKERGFATGAAVSAWVLRSDSGLGGAFDFYDDRIEMRSREAAGRLQRPGEQTIGIAERWIRERSGQPFFFMLHLFEPHAPYEAPEPFRTEYAARPYDGEVAATDALVGRFLDFLRANNLYESATIIFLSDHGEGLMDHGEQEHGLFLYREAIHVPLIVKLPNSHGAGRSVAAPAQLIDVLPTVAHVAGIPSNKTWPGKSLVDLAEEKDPAARAVFSETLYPRLHLGWSDLRSLVDANHHYIEAPRPELYDIRRDPREQSNIIADQRRTYAALREQLAVYSKNLAAPSAVHPEEAKKLQALGYLGSTSVLTTDANLPDPKDGLDDLRLIQEASELARRGEQRAAIERLESAISRNPRFTDALANLAILYDDVGEFEKAAATYKKAIEANPTNAAGPAASLGWLYLRQGRFDEAEAHAKIAVATYPAYAHLLLGRIALARGDLLNAGSYAQKCMSDPSYRIAGMILMAQVLSRSGRAAEALPLLDRAKRERLAEGGDPEQLLAFARGDALARLNRAEEAEVAFREETRLFPQDPEAWAHLAVICLLQGKAKEAEQAMESLVRAVPRRESYDLAAGTFKKMGHPERAATWRRRGESLKQNN
jgi:arylsulfatase A-like enzyme/thioredoxin-like negative regulator of GroEL